MRNMVVLSLLANSSTMRTVFASSQAASEDWRVIYEKDSNGKAILGTLTALINAFKGMNI